MTRSLSSRPSFTESSGSAGDHKSPGGMPGLFSFWAAMQLRAQGAVQGGSRRPRRAASPSNGGYSPCPHGGPSDRFRAAYEKISGTCSNLFESTCAPANLTVETASTVGRDAGNGAAGRSVPEAEQAGRAGKLGRTPVVFGSERYLTLV